LGQAVEESNLTVQIAALRRVLGSASGGDRWIETMPRRGYRFVGPVVPQGEKTSSRRRRRPMLHRTSQPHSTTTPNAGK